MDWSYHLGMAQLHMSESELVRNIQSVLQRVREGAEVVVEEGLRTVAVISPAPSPGRPIDECIAAARNSSSALDEDFAAELREILASRRPVDTSVWE